MLTHFETRLRKNVIQKQYFTSATGVVKGSDLFKNAHAVYNHMRRHCKSNQMGYTRNTPIEKQRLSIEREWFEKDPRK